MQEHRQLEWLLRPQQLQRIAISFLLSVYNAADGSKTETPGHTKLD